MEGKVEIPKMGGNYPGSSAWAQCGHKGSSQGLGVRGASLEHGSRLEVMPAPLEGRRQETESPLETSGGTSPAGTWASASLRLLSSKGVRRYMCICFKPLNLWSFVTAAVGNEDTCNSVFNF